MADGITLLGALYLSEGWHERWLIFRRPRYRARAAVLFDRAMAGELKRHEQYLEQALAERKPAASRTPRALEAAKGFCIVGGPTIVVSTALGAMYWMAGLPAWPLGVVGAAVGIGMGACGAVLWWRHG